MIAILLINNVLLIQIGPFMIGGLMMLFNIKGYGEGYPDNRYAIRYDTGSIGLLIFSLLIVGHVITNRLCLEELGKMKYYFWIIEFVVALFVFLKVGPFLL